MTWNCAAIDHGVAIFPNGKIGPCCQVSADYLKPIESLRDPNRFLDLKTKEVPSACEACSRNEKNNIPSYRSMFNRTATSVKGIQFVDIRNTNHCNLKCRYCGPHFSSSWAKELNLPQIVHQDIEQYKSILISDSLHWMYFTGGEPLINPEHWNLLIELVATKKSQNISLMYNTNLTTIKYKDIDIISLWSEFKKVHVNCSIDAVGLPFEYIRSGAKWKSVDQNLQTLIQSPLTNICVVLSPVLSILNIWVIKDLFEYAKTHNIDVNLIHLTGPDYLSINVIPDCLKSLAFQKLDEFANYLTQDQQKYIKEQIDQNINQCLFSHTLQHVMLLDKLRGENLFDQLPFKELAIDNILKNHEYQLQ
jgi:sulfatase maturation enzyme AslB (radical SAM superfamily)